MLYFAYGSNLSLAQMDNRCPGHRPIRKHRLPGFRLVLRGAANIEDAPGEHIEGAIYEITEEHERALGGYEGAPTVYDQQWFETEDGPVLYYRMVEPHFIPPREGYVETIEAGYRDWELPTTSLDKAKERQRQEYGITA
jgi:hypothetical protein